MNNNSQPQNMPGPIHFCGVDKLKIKPKVYNFKIKEPKVINQPPVNQQQPNSNVNIQNNNIIPNNVNNNVQPHQPNIPPQLKDFY